VKSQDNVISVITPVYIQVALKDTRCRILMKINFYVINPYTHVHDLINLDRIKLLILVKSNYNLIYEISRVSNLNLKIPEMSHSGEKPF
jgi:hypothetical protein